jgi:hypothetical protein
MAVGDKGSKRKPKRDPDESDNDEEFEEKVGRREGTAILVTLAEADLHSPKSSKTILMTVPKQKPSLRREQKRQSLPTKMRRKLVLDVERAQTRNMMMMADHIS